jgi:hypothetical protein
VPAAVTVYNAALNMCRVDDYAVVLSQQRTQTSAARDAKRRKTDSPPDATSAANKVSAGKGKRCARVLCVCVCVRHYSLLRAYRRCLRQ